MPGNRQAAYVARNRAALVRAALEVLAEVGTRATIEQLAAHAQISPTTIYKYFANKEALFAEALLKMFEEWTQWANQVLTTGDPLEMVLDDGRRYFRIRQHNPFMADVLHNVWKDPAFVVSVLGQDADNPFFALAKMGAVKSEEFKERKLLWQFLYTGILTSVYVTEDMSAEEADAAFGVGLSVWGISEAQAKEIISRDLIFPSTSSFHP